MRLFNSLDSRKGAQLHSFGSTLPIRGNVTLGTRELYLVKAGQAGLIRGTSYDVYTGTGWKIGKRDTQRVNGGELGVTAQAGQYKERVPAILQVQVKDGDNTILSAGTPLGTNRDARVETPNGFGGDIEQIRSLRGLQNGDTYNTLGSQSKATPEQLQAATTAYPAWVTDRYLGLPGDLQQRVRAEAARVASGGQTPYDKALLLEEFLRGFPYNLQVPATPPKRDAVDYFLFDLKAGYFDYNASAMAVMLRTLGIPARVAVGYVLDPARANETTYTVRRDDAYSWVEVFFPEYGWINFNPTPDRPSSSGGFGGDAGSDVFSGIDLGGVFSGDPNILPTDLPPEVQAPLTAAPTNAPQARSWLWLWVLLALAAVAASGALGTRLAWNWGLGGLQGRARLWAKLHRLAGWAGLGGRPQETPREWSRRLGSAVAREPEAVQLAAAYEEARYGRPDLQRIDESETDAAYRQLRNTLVGRVFRRKARSAEGERRGRRRRGQ